MMQGWYFLASAAFVSGETQMRLLAVLMALLALVSSPLAAQDANGNGAGCSNMSAFPPQACPTSA